MGVANGSQTKGLVKSVGDITYCTRNGKTISRKKIVSNSSKTSAQMKQRRTFGAIGHLSRRFHEVIMKGFMKNKADFSPMNTFVHLNVPCVTVTYNEANKDYDVKIDYSRLICADGDLFSPEVTGTIDKENGKIVITVDTPIPGGRYFADDQIFLVVYEKDRELCLLHQLGPRTETGSKEIPIPRQWNAEALEVYAFANSAEGKMSSSSIYLCQ